MMTQVPPFMMALNNDEMYREFPMNRANRFWQKHESGRPAGFFSESFKDLITVMFQQQPAQRYNMSDLMGHPWIQEDTATINEVKQEFKARKERFDAALQA